MLPRTRTGEAALRIITVNHVAVPAAFTRMPLVDVVVVDFAPTFGRRDVLASLALDVRR
jgi:hypothetical protein